MVSQSEQELLTLAEAAQRLRLSRNTVYKFCQTGLIPARRVGRQWRIRVSDLDAWLDRPPVDARPRPGAGRDILADPADYWEGR